MFFMSIKAEVNPHRFIPSLCYVMVGSAMEAAAHSSSSRELNQTPTWAVATVFAVFNIISMALEKIIHELETWCKKRHKKALSDALEKVKAELMILGFISLLLIFGQNYISPICVPIEAAEIMWPCAKKESSTTEYLASDSNAYRCKTGYAPIISVKGLHQLHILAFLSVIFHVLCNGITMMLWRVKIRGWKEWEKETSSHDYEFSNDHSRLGLTLETSSVTAHTSFWSRIGSRICSYLGSFQQFFRSVNKDDYLTLRAGYISAHVAPGSKFNFQKHIKRSFEDDFKLVAGVSPGLRALFVIFLLLDIQGWHALFWASLIPPIIMLAIGIQLQAILTKVALEITERHAADQVIPLVQGSDEYFWFGRPQLILHLIHFALFQNAFQITYFFWIWHSFGLKSCFHASFKLALIEVALGVFGLCLCSYITLPLYAIVSQMGSSMKKPIIDDQTSKAPESPTVTRGSSSTVSEVHSSGHARGPHRFNTTGHSTSGASIEDSDDSDVETDTLPLTSSTYQPDC